MSIIYEPKGRAREYAPLAANLYNGCSHGCRYCYVPTIPPWKFSKTARADFHANPRPRPGIIAQLRRECQKTPGNGKRVLLSFTTDPYQHIDQDHHLTRQAIEILHAAGYAVEVLTKGGYRALADRDVFGTQDAFASTLTFLDAERSVQWEPGAAVPEERIYTIAAFHQSGIPTWVSLEPVIDPESALEIIRETHDFVDLYKVGKINHHPLSDSINWRLFGIRGGR